MHRIRKSGAGKGEGERVCRTQMMRKRSIVLDRRWDNWIVWLTVLQCHIALDILPFHRTILIYSRTSRTKFEVLN